jgi:hypothetical protein
MPPTPVSSVFPEYEVLSPGKHIWGRLAEEDQSFTVTFHDLYAVVSFETNPSLSDVKCAARWVRIRLLEPIEQLKLSSSGKDVVFLQGILAGAEVKVEKEVPQTIVYVHWKRQTISIQYK